VKQVNDKSGFILANLLITILLVSLMSLLSYQIAQNSRNQITLHSQLIRELTLAEERLISQLMNIRSLPSKQSAKPRVLEEPLNPSNSSSYISVTARIKSRKGSVLEIISWDLLE
jgi:type II secretory pathway component PulJ